MSRPVEEQEPNAFLGNTIWPMAAGKSKVNLTIASMELSSIGFVRACWGEEPTTGGEFLSVLALVILKVKTVTD